jgi:glutathione S-transferase
MLHDGLMLSSYVLLTVSGTFITALWHGARVMKFRKDAGIPYPNAYASQETISAADPTRAKAMYLFNCAQRSHANFLENYPTVLAGLLVSGLSYPVTTASLGFVWILSRIAYAIGYTDAGKEKGSGRYKYPIGPFFWFCQMGLWGLTVKAGFDLIRK